MILKELAVNTASDAVDAISETFGNLIVNNHSLTARVLAEKHGFQRIVVELPDVSPDVTPREFRDLVKPAIAEFIGQLNLYRKRFLAFATPDVTQFPSTPIGAQVGVNLHLEDGKYAGYLEALVLTA